MEGEFLPLLSLPKLSAHQQPWGPVVVPCQVDRSASMGYVEAGLWDPSSLEGTKVPDRLSQLGDHKPWDWLPLNQDKSELA